MGGESFGNVKMRPVFTHAELDEKVASLFAVGGVYELVAYYTELDNRAHCTGEPTGRKAPWESEDTSSAPASSAS